MQSAYLERPTLWSLQAILLLERKYLYELAAPVCAIWNSTAARIAQTMGLNRLGSAVDDVWRNAAVDGAGKADGNAPLRPSGTTGTRASRAMVLAEFAEGNILQRELARKLWYAILGFDWYLSAHVDYCHSIPDVLNRTAPPADLDDSAVVDLGARCDTLDPLSVEAMLQGAGTSHNLYPRVNVTIARCVRDMASMRFEHMFTSGSSEFGDADVLAFDHRLRSILRDLPDVFRLDGQTESRRDVKSILSERPYLALQRMCVQEQVYFRLMLLHRPYLDASCEYGLFRKSVAICTEAARIILATCQELERTGNPNQRLWNVRAHLIHAAIVLYTILTNEAAQVAVPAASLKHDLQEAIFILDKRENEMAKDRFPQLASTLIEVRKFCMADHREADQRIPSYPSQAEPGLTEAAQGLDADPPLVHLDSLDVLSGSDVFSWDLDDIIESSNWLQDVIQST